VVLVGHYADGANGGSIWAVNEKDPDGPLFPSKCLTMQQARFAFNQVASGEFNFLNVVPSMPAYGSGDALQKCGIRTSYKVDEAVICVSECMKHMHSSIYAHRQ
jgi:hypothetical protein